jgi:predicted RNase H-like nuclease
LNPTCLNLVSHKQNASWGRREIVQGWEMSVVLGIDAAWTEKNPSGVALAVKNSDGWKLVIVSNSYENFYANRGFRLNDENSARGSRLDVCLLLSSVFSLCGKPANVIALDIPLSRQPITGRRTSDKLVSSKYGARKAGTYTPSSDRPGPISNAMRADFESAGYQLQTRGPSTSNLLEVYPHPALNLLEVYPHPALVELMDAPERLKYKFGKIRKYWAGDSPLKRREFVLEQWSRIAAKLDTKISGVVSALPDLQPDASGKIMKAYEDCLDAIVCAWVAICAIEGNAIPFGDEDSAIWIPKAATDDA